jgi:transglutaminase-like putative cysteine protease
MGEQQGNTMAFDRRDFLKLSGAGAAMVLMPVVARAQERFISEPGPWRKFEIVTRVAIGRPQGRTQAWIPVPAMDGEDWSEAQGSDWKTNAKIARLERDAASGAEMVYFEWAENEPAPSGTVSSHARTRDRFTDFAQPRKLKPLSENALKRYTAPSAGDASLPETAARITEKAKTDLGKAKAIYEWIVENQDCAVPQVNLAGALGGLNASKPVNCDGLNALYVGLARAAGLPARLLQGLRVAPSLFGYQSLGAASENLSEAQHCRGEVWLEGYGWVPVDPADVRRAARMEPGNLALADAKIVAARVTLFGGWEGNWVAYNAADAVTLQESAQPAVPELKYPLARTGGVMLNPRETDQISFTIAAKELPA